MDKQNISAPNSRLLNNIPFSLTTLRLLIAPVMIVLAIFNAPRPVFTVLIITAFLSDWLDGVAARWLGIATVFLRRYDIVADLTFYFAVLVSACFLEYEAVLYYRYQFILLLILEVSCQVFT
jgi:phosphatidylglycerophosphate synthase